MTSDGDSNNYNYNDDKNVPLNQYCYSGYMGIWVAGMS